jgi:hypothetical protein
LPRCLTTDEWIKKIYLYTIYFHYIIMKEILFMIKGVNIGQGEDKRRNLRGEYA